MDYSGTYACCIALHGSGDTVTFNTAHSSGRQHPRARRHRVQHPLQTIFPPGWPGAKTSAATTSGALMAGNAHRLQPGLPRVIAVKGATTVLRDEYAVGESAPWPHMSDLENKLRVKF